MLVYVMMDTLLDNNITIFNGIVLHTNLNLNNYDDGFVESLEGTEEG